MLKLYLLSIIPVVPMLNGKVETSFHWIYLLCIAALCFLVSVDISIYPPTLNEQPNVASEK